MTNMKIQRTLSGPFHKSANVISGSFFMQTALLAPSQIAADMLGARALSALKTPRRLRQHINEIAHLGLESVINSFNFLP